MCCDVSAEWTALAREAWTAAGVAGRVTLRLAPALQTLDALITGGAVGTFDLAFVDADKGNYLAYHERCLRLVRRGGVLLYDNVLWSGRVAGPGDASPDTAALRAFNEALARDERIDLSMLPLGDGLTLARVR